MKQPTHTPLEWQIRSQYEPTIIIGNVDGPDDGQYHYEVVAELDNAANAAIIVKAVNCHAELVKTLERAKSDLEFHLRTGPGGLSMEQAEAKTSWISAALAKAGVK